MKHKLILTTPNDVDITIVRSFNARRPLVFDCYTKPELVKQWMTGPPGWSFAVCDIDLRVGGRFRFVWRGPEAAELASGGVYKEIVIPEKLVNTEKYDQDWTGGETLGTAAFSEAGGVTTVTTLIHYASKEARDGALSSGMDQGMAAGFDRLDEFLATRS